MFCRMPARPAALRRNALYDTPDGIAAKLEALHCAGVEYVLLTTLGGTPQLDRFAREIMPAFAGRRHPAEIAAAPSAGG